jgi:hypothetical protein
MTERRKDLLALALLLALLVLYFSKILFTDRIIRAPDITNEFYWMVKHFKGMSLGELFRIQLQADWNPYINSGATDAGGNISMQFLLYRSLLFWLIPEPANIAWFIVFHLFLGGAGAYCYCRAIGTSRPAAFLAGLVFAVAPEIASLINAGHVQKIATISFAPWAFFFLERGFQARRVIYPLATAVTLALQFFNMHWQIAFYTCLGIAVYGVGRSVGILVSERSGGKSPLPRLLLLNLVTLLFFLSTVAISLLPLADWSRDTNRGAQSGANQGKGGLELEEAMSWSMPPEELATFVIPGFFGLSRQEGGFNAADHGTYYWGRMVFTQTTDYLGLLPWLLAPLPLVFRRDRYTWLAVAGIVLGLLFSMGKYTGFYWLLYEHFPGINRFRVPKMMMIIPVLGLGVLAARGFDCLLDGEVRASRGFRRYLWGVAALPVALLVILGILKGGEQRWLATYIEHLAEPTRYEQGPQLMLQRWNNLLRETEVAIGVALACGAALFVSGRWVRSPILVAGLLATLLLADTGRVNAKFMLLQPMPAESRGARTPTMDFLLGQGVSQYRVLPMQGVDPMTYATNKIPVMFTSNPVQIKRWQDLLDSFSLASPMADMLNVRYLVFTPDQYLQERAALGEKYAPVYQSPRGDEVVVENRSVLPKAWLVPAAMVVTPEQALALLREPRFDPRLLGLVETPPSIPLAGAIAAGPSDVGPAAVTRYEGNRVTVQAEPRQNALLVLGDKFHRYWQARLDGAAVPIQPVNYILRGVYLTPGRHTVEFFFDPLPFKVGKYLTLTSFAFFAIMLVREWRYRRRV